MDKTGLFFMIFFIILYKDVLSKKHMKHGVKKEGRIVGGYNVTIQDVPYQVYVLVNIAGSYYGCGGSIISERYVLTAAHCLTGVTYAYIRIGSTDSDSGGSTYYSTILKQHPRYNAQTSDYDVGLIRTFRNMKLDGKNAKVVKLPPENNTVVAGTEILVSGWGDTSENGNSSKYLLAVKIPTVSTDDCRQAYGSSITSRMFCAGNPEGGKDSCQGDSGGPAVAESTGMQVGIVSFGQGCARADYPGVYTNVSAVRSWIRTNSGV